MGGREIGFSVADDQEMIEGLLPKWEVDSCPIGVLAVSASQDVFENDLCAAGDIEFARVSFGFDGDFLGKIHHGIIEPNAVFLRSGLEDLYCVGIAIESGLDFVAIPPFRF